MLDRSKLIFEQNIRIWHFVHHPNFNIFYHLKYVVVIGINGNAMLQYRVTMVGALTPIH